MRSTSSRRSAVALLLCGTLLWRSATPVLAAEAGASTEPALLLKYAAPDLTDPSARQVLDPIPAIVAKELRIRWLPVPMEPSGRDPSAGEIPVPDDAALRRIAGTVSRASERMEKVESEAASLLLEEAEKECRSYRFTEATRPFLAEIFLRRGILRLWEGKASDAEALFSRVLALRPGFTPDPALFPPQVLSVWEAIRHRPVPEAELLVESLPSGAEIFVDGERRGVTPARVRMKNIAPVRIRVSHPGYRDAETTGQWLPGDTEIVRFSLPGDRVARLGELLAGAAQGKGGGAGPLVEELSAAAGTSRVAILMLEKGAGGEGLRTRLYAGRPSGQDPALLGEKAFPEGKKGAELAGKWTAETLAADGWPRAERPERRWYNSFWFWGIVLTAAFTAVLGSGGGGGGGGSSAGTVAVNF
ncbi:PEGA domain-containing protein [Candidatus Deferrimicrobium sp.]|uniref:PEGA domain-containing protein n=1 Tax=Candidatus Deferrimicrobium sp. TaxID=3060586 RepID=UPI003C650DCF